MRDALSFELEEGPVLLDAELERFIQTQTFPSSIKLSTGKYLLVNSVLAARDGMQAEDYQGLTAYDIKEITHRKPEVTEQAVHMDNQIFSGKIPLACYRQSLVTFDRTVMIEEVVKRPVFDADNHIVGLFAHGSDITRSAHPIALFKLYESYYTEEEAIRAFLRYKKIAAVFHSLPTKEELLTLLVMRETLDVKVIAKRLKYTPQQVKTHQKNLHEKLKVIGIHDCLMYLSYFSEHTGQDAIGWD